LKVDGEGRKRRKRKREQEKENIRQPASDAEVETACLRKERCIDLPRATSFI
jgi:hypothetical protein